MTPKENDNTMGLGSPDVKRSGTDSTKDGSPDSKASDDTMVMEAPDGYIEPMGHDVLLSDVTSEKLRGEVAEELEVAYLSVVPREDEAQLSLQRTFLGTKYGPNSRFMVNIPCRRHSMRNDPQDPRAPLCFHNIIFLIDTGSPYTYLCQEAMEALLDGNGGNPMPVALNVELSVGLQLRAHLSPVSGHFEDVNLLGGAAFFQAVDIVSLRRTTGFTLTFD